MVKAQDPVWLRCKIVGQDGQPAIVPGFCDRLVAEFTRLSGRDVGAGGRVPDGASILGVILLPQSAHRASVLLSLSRQTKAGVVEIRQQELNLGSADSPLGAGSAGTLIYPLVQLLGPSP